MQNWGANRLSQAGSIVLVKAVAQAIPKYVMGCFLLPDRLLYDFESMSANFFWQQGEKQSTHWLSWKKLCRNKQGRGLGFRSWKTFNVVCLQNRRGGLSRPLSPSLAV
ncbi:UNVERIFIED_CONTAM: hypothetical protein Sradi_2015700 [Sesamum radiatum]|uniref:Uncharacterized protein n=1 Tax=Sesamum radiatum TaxID=300843 RepID=A0AAW2TGJ2_SESRA